MGLFSSSSKSSSSSTTQNFDNRVVADAQGQGVSNGGQVAKDYAQPINLNVAGGGKKSATYVDVNLMTTDYGAIESAIEFADSAQGQANQTIHDVLNISKDNFDQTTEALSNAYQDAKGGALVLQNVTIGMMMTIAAVAYFWLGKKKT